MAYLLTIDNVVDHYLHLSMQVALGLRCER